MSGLREKEMTIAVVPFRNLSSEPETEYFANGFVEDLTRELTRFPSLRVLAAQSAFGLALADQSAERLSSKWGLDFMLQGTIRWGDTGLRVGVQLIRVEGGEIVWAERVDAPPERVFAVQDEIVAQVAGRLAVQIDEMRLRAARRRTSESLAAYECWLRGMDCLKRSSLEGDEESRRFFTRALEIDPEYARAYSGLSLSHFNEWTCQAWHLWDESGPLAFNYARRAVELDGNDAMAHSVLARVFRFRRQHEEADRHAERALKLNPNDAHVLIQVAVTKLFGGEFDESFRLACKARDLNPLHQDWYLGIIGWNLFMLRRYDEANDYLSKAREAIVELPAYRTACAAIAGDLGRARYEHEIFVREYRNKIAFGREPEPNEPLRWAVQVEPFRDIEHSRRLPDALRDAGIAEIDVDEAVRSRMSLRVRPAEIACAPGNSFTHEGSVWSVAYRGTGAKLVELKGFHDIARLLAQPHEPLHCLELSGAPQEGGAPDEVLDRQARRDYRRRIEELQREIEQGESNNDPARSVPARQELDILIDELMKATGWGGRSRKMAHSAERARTAVTWRIRSAIKKIAAAHPQMGQHLSNSIGTGYFCVYSPESDCSWEL
jgi:TolB-like protein/tetratricopeptide (TPR) repeat protein